MPTSYPPPSAGPFANLRRFVAKRAPLERCEMCSRAVAPEHQHLIDREERRLICVCDACAVLFTIQEGTKLRRVPRRVRFLSNFQISDAQWNSLAIPIGLVFFFKSTPQDRVVAFYPGPAGATESLLPLEAWKEIVAGNPVLAGLEPDVEALLANRVGSEQEIPATYCIAPIDECYKLVGIIRAHWRGLSGGTEVWREIAAFSAALRSKSESPGEWENA